MANQTEKYQVGQPVYANQKNIQSFQAKKEVINLDKRLNVNYENVNANQLKAPLLAVYGQVDQDFTSKIKTFVGGEQVGTATGETTISDGKVYHKIKVSLPAKNPYGIQQGLRKRNLTFFGTEKAGTYSDYSTEGWFASEDITSDKVEALNAYDPKTDKYAPAGLTASGGKPEPETKNNTLIIVLGAVIVLALAGVAIFKKK